jgi:hypothetical protein
LWLPTKFEIACGGLDRKARQVNTPATSGV